MPHPSAVDRGSRLSSTSGGVLFYAGPSMNPLLRVNDLLEVRPCGPAGAEPGDVIVFRDVNSGLIVVHRVVAVGAAGWITRGDNNGGRDTAPVRADQIIGRVSVAWRGAKKIEVAGGRRALRAARILWLRRACGRHVARLLRACPRRLTEDRAGG